VSHAGRSPRYKDCYVSSRAPQLSSFHSPLLLLTFPLIAVLTGLPAATTMLALPPLISRDAVITQ
ncbi:hypothetical protein SCHPADRAFT_911918, partial [Schizopora paradoxa]